MDASKTDAAAVEASLQTPQSFTEIFDRHFESIHSYLSRRIGSQLADDLALEVLQAFKSRARFDVTSTDARPWLYGIASRLLSHHHRAERRRLFAYARAASQEVVPDVTEDIDARADAAATSTRLAEGRARLTARTDSRGVAISDGVSETCPRATGRMTGGPHHAIPANGAIRGSNR